MPVSHPGGGQKRDGDDPISPLGLGGRIGFRCCRERGAMDAVSRSLWTLIGGSSETREAGNTWREKGADPQRGKAWLSRGRRASTT